jgi:putative membrane protein
MWGPGGNWGMMDGWTWGWYGAGHMLFWLVIIILVVAGVAWFARSGSRRGNILPLSDQRSSALTMLEERYARGEIDREEYLQKKRDLAG